MKSNIGISEKNLKSSVQLLSAALSNEMVLYIKTRKSHWNVTGDSFMELHKVFENQYKQLEESIDEIAERIGKLGQKTMATMTEFIKHSKLKENPGVFGSSKEIITELLHDHEAVIRVLRDDIDICSDKNKDAGTADFLTKLMEDHETMAWILRRYLDET